MRWIALILIVVAVGAFHTAGLVLAGLGLGGAYIVSCRLNPRVRHKSGLRHCNGSGEIRGWFFPHAFHRCPNCAGGRQIRWGSRHWGPGYIRAEHETGKAARKDRKQRRVSR